MRKALLAVSLLLLMTPVLAQEEIMPVLISAIEPVRTQVMNQSQLREVVSTAVQTMTQEIEQVRIRINETEVTINASELTVDATHEMKQVRVTAREMTVNGLELLDEAVGVKAQVMAQVSTMEGIKVMNMIQEQNQLRIESVGVNTTVSLVLNEHVRVEDNQLILNKSGIERVLTVLPEQAMNQVRATNVTINSMELVVEAETPVYKIQETRQARLFGFIPVSLSVESRVDATNGELVSQARPWWSFLTIE